MYVRALPNKLSLYAIASSTLVIGNHDYIYICIYPAPWKESWHEISILDRNAGKRNILPFLIHIDTVYEREVGGGGVIMVV